MPSQGGSRRSAGNWARHGKTERRRDVQNTNVEPMPEHLIHLGVVAEVHGCPGGHDVSVERPVRAQDKSGVGSGLVANVMARRVVDRMPLYRQSKALVRRGVKFHRNTLLGVNPNACLTGVVLHVQGRRRFVQGKEVREEAGRPCSGTWHSRGAARCNPDSGHCRSRS